MKEKLLSLIAYSFWANSLIYNTLLKENITDEKIHVWASHIINAEVIWMDRIEGVAANTSVFGKRAIETLIPMLSSCNKRLEALVHSRTEDELKNIVSYTDTEGNPYENELSDLLFHLINHSTHHRSQIAARLRDMGISPPPSDYIYFKR